MIFEYVDNLFFQFCVSVHKSIFSVTFDSFLPGTGLSINDNIEKIMQKFCGTLLMEEGNAFQKASSLNNMK